MGPGGTPFASQPLLSEAGAEQEAWGSPAHCGDQGPVSTMVWTPLLLVLLSLCTGSAGPGHRGSVPGLRQPPGRRLLEPFLQLLPHCPRVCICRLRLPAWADSARLPLCVSRSISQTLLHPEQRLQCWWLPNVLFPAEAREPSLGAPDVQVRLQ